jgi:hypothetical protein
MEGKVKRRRSLRSSLKFLLAFAWGLVSAAVFAQESRQRDPAQLNLRRSVNTREYQGKEIEGAERVIARGDSLWRILVQDKGVPERRFHSYLVVIRGLNPQLKNSDVLRVGESIFIPLRPEDALSGEAAAVKNPATSGKVPENGVTVSYRVKAGESLYRILRTQLAISDNRKIATYAALVKDLNPEKQNWDSLQEGEVIRLPGVGESRVVASSEPKAAIPAKPPEAESVSESRIAQNTKSTAPADSHDPRRLRARDNLTILAKVVEALGGQFQSAGEEVVTVKDATIRIDKSNYPVIYSPKLHQKVVLDPQDKIPAALRTNLSDPRIGMPVVAMTEQVSLHDAVTQLLAGLGYQSLPLDRPVVIQDADIAFEAHGSWMVLAPEESNRAQEIHIINLTDTQDEIPAYLKSQLAVKGLHLQDVLLPSATAKLSVTNAGAPKKSVSQVKAWPRDNTEMVDSLLLAYGIPFGVAETLSVELREGLRMDTRADRIFELGGRRIAMFFQRAEPEIKKALREKEGTEAVELQLGALSARETIGILLNVLGDQTVYREHRFTAANGINQDNLILTAWGFLVAKKSIFVTDREIPRPLHRFFFEKGLEIVYFR